MSRRNWLFVASDARGTPGRRSILMSLVASAKANHVEPWSWLRDVFTRLPLLGRSPSAKELSPLLPDRWLEAHPKHRWHIADQRQTDRLRNRDSPVLGRAVDSIRHETPFQDVIQFARFGALQFRELGEFDGATDWRIAVSADFRNELAEVSKFELMSFLKIFWSPAGLKDEAPQNAPIALILMVMRIKPTSTKNPLNVASESSASQCRRKSHIR